MKKKNEMLLQVIMPEKKVDTLCKIQMAYILHMPKGDKHFYEKVDVVLDYLDQALPSHPGAFAMYFKIYDLLPATSSRVIPAELGQFIVDNWTEIEKYYEDGKLPEKFWPKDHNKPTGIVDAHGEAIHSKDAPKLILV